MVVFDFLSLLSVEFIVVEVKVDYATRLSSVSRKRFYRESLEITQLGWSDQAGKLDSVGGIPCQRLGDRQEDG